MKILITAIIAMLTFTGCNVHLQGQVDGELENPQQTSGK